MTPRDKARARSLADAMSQYQAARGALPGLASPAHLETLVAQFIDSLRRVEFAHYIRDARHDNARMDPASDMFDPLRAAVMQNRVGKTDEAWWLVFLATHFGKHSQDKWRLVRDVYGKLGQGGFWDWSTVTDDTPKFRKWLVSHQAILKGEDGVTRRFSNHRKYEGLKGTPAVIASYVAWIAPFKTHSRLVRELHKKVGQDPQAVFAELYNSMDSVHRFGRLGKFDFLAMLGKLGIAPIDPGSTFLKDATGPLAGARLLFGGEQKAKLAARDLEVQLEALGASLGLGAQVLEDALCNWQKSPATYIRFKG